MAMNLGRNATAFGLAFILAATPTMGIAANIEAAPAPINPYAVISAFGSPAAVSALGATAPAVVAAGAAAAAQDEYPAGMSDNTSKTPAFIVLGGMVAWALLFIALSDDDDDDDDEAIPVSPA